MIKVIIADDHFLVREAWKFILSRDTSISVVAVCDDGSAAITACKELDPDIILMDINMQPMNGIEATRRIRIFSDTVKIIGISIHNDYPYVKALMQAGANGYVTKNSSCEEMLKAIAKTMKGEKYFCNEVREIMPNQ
jgi:two-component system, NarL family, invasion response regulator UvrY